MDTKRSTERFRVISFVKIVSESNQTECGRLIDISSHGMRVRSRKSFHTERPFQFSMKVPHADFHEKIIRFDASVVWTSKSEVDGYYEAGLQIESATQKNFEVINQFLNNLSDQNLQIEVDECYANDQ